MSPAVIRLAMCQKRCHGDTPVAFIQAARHPLHMPEVGDAAHKRKAAGFTGNIQPPLAELPDNSKPRLQICFLPGWLSRPEIDPEYRRSQHVQMIAVPQKWIQAQSASDPLFRAMRGVIGHGVPISLHAVPHAAPQQMAGVVPGNIIPIPRRTAGICVVIIIVEAEQAVDLPRVLRKLCQLFHALQRRIQGKDIRIIVIVPSMLEAYQIGQLSPVVRPGGQLENQLADLFKVRRRGLAGRTDKNLIDHLIPVYVAGLSRQTVPHAYSTQSPSAFRSDFIMRYHFNVHTGRRIQQEIRFYGQYVHVLLIGGVPIRFGPAVGNVQPRIAAAEQRSHLRIPFALRTAHKGRKLIVHLPDAQHSRQPLRINDCRASKGVQNPVIPMIGLAVCADGRIDQATAMGGKRQPGRRIVFNSCGKAVQSNGYQMRLRRFLYLLQ